jgi:hemerythrin superfamily protein
MTEDQMGATDLLREQHDQVRALFSPIEAASGEQLAELFDCLRKTLAVHETAEEIVVHPEARQLGSDGARIVEVRLREEAEAKQALADLEKLGPDGEGFGVELRRFKNAADAHATAEEQELFPLLEANLTSAKLSDMADAIRVAESLAPTHPHPHGPESAIGNVLVGPFVAMADKVRDKLQEHNRRRAS